MVKGTREQAKKRYAYETYEDREGNKKLRSISQKKYAEGDLPDNLIFSPKSPKQIQERQQAYSEGFIGLGNKTHSEDYADTIEWGQMGGRPKKWASNTERMQAHRAKIKLAQGQTLNFQERKLLGLTKSRPGAYRSGLGRPLTPAEKMRILRAKRNKS